MKTNKSFIKNASFVVFLLCLSSCPIPCLPLPAYAMDGLSLARQVHDRDDGRDSYVKFDMVLIDKNGNKRERALTIAAKDYGALVKTCIRFTAPPSIKGTSFLTWENEGRNDDQFLYLPELRRVRRIVSSQKDNNFANTDYTYEDLERRKVSEDSHRILVTEKYEGRECWVLESIPRDAGDSQYGKRISWVISDSFVVARVDFYDKKGRLIKQFKAGKVEKIDGIWTVTESEMTDLKKKHSTLLRIQEVLYNTGISDQIFSKQYLLHAE